MGMAEPDEQTSESVAALVRTVEKLRSERDGLREAMKQRAVIEQAKGMLAHQLSLSPEDAFQHLVELSTRNNVKLVELAAAMVSRTQDEPVAVDEVGVETAPVVPETMDEPVTALPIDLGTLRSEIQLLGTRIAAATTFDELADGFSAATAGWPRPASVTVMLVEGGGALRLAGATGLSAASRSQWERVPPIETIPVVAAVRNRAPVYLADLEEVSRQYPVAADRPPEALLAMPLIDDDNVIGAVEITWSAPPRLDKSARSQLLELAAPAARRCVALKDEPESFTGPSTGQDNLDTGLISMFMETLSSPAVLLTARYGDDGEVVDFDAELSNDAAAPLATNANGTPASLLTALPDSGIRKLLPAFVATLRDGNPCVLRKVAVSTRSNGRPRVHHVDVRAGRVWDRVLVTWRVEPETIRQYASLLVAEEAFDIGGFFHDLGTGEALWTPGMFRITGFDPSRDVPSLEDVTALIHRGDQDAIVDQAATALRAGESWRADLRGDGTLEGRVFQLVVRAEMTSEGDIAAIRGVCRDVTEFRRLDEHRRRDRMFASAADSERAGLRTVLDAILTPPDRPGVSGFAITGSRSGTSGMAHRSWHDTVERPDGSVVLVVGEVRGDEPTASMLLLRHAAIAHAVAGANPAEVLTAVNTLFRAVCPQRAATMTLAELEVGSGAVRWAVSGQSPVVVSRAAGEATLSSAALGLPIGAADSIDYMLNETTLEDGDRLLMNTESLSIVPDEVRSRLFEALCDASGADSAHDAAGLVREREPSIAEVEASLLLVRRTR